jgi:hypothetical protein
MSVVRGKNVVFSLVLAQSWTISTVKIIACARSCTLTTTTTLIETTTKGSGKGATYKPYKNNTTGTLEGVVFLNEPGKTTLPFLRQVQIAQAILRGEILRTDEDGSTYKDIINFYITSLTDTGSVGDFNTFQMDIQVTGDPVIVATEVGPGPGTQPERAIYWRWGNLEPILNDLLVFSHTAPHVLNADMEVSVSGMPSDNWFVLKYPADENNPVAWFNTVFNNGSIPDSAFNSPVTIGGWKYIKSRTAITFDTTATVKFTH